MWFFLRFQKLFIKKQVGRISYLIYSFKIFDPKCLASYFNLVSLQQKGDFPDFYVSKHKQFSITKTCISVFLKTNYFLPFVMIALNVKHSIFKPVNSYIITTTFLSKIP